MLSKCSFAQEIQFHTNAFAAKERLLVFFLSATSTLGYKRNCSATSNGFFVNKIRHDKYPAQTLKQFHKATSLPYITSFPTQRCLGIIMPSKFFRWKHTPSLSCMHRWTTWSFLTILQSWNIWDVPRTSAAAALANLGTEDQASRSARAGMSSKWNYLLGL